MTFIRQMNVINPLTNRSIKVNGPTFKRLVRSGVTFDGQKLTLTDQGRSTLRLTYELKNMTVPEEYMHPIFDCPEILCQIFAFLSIREIVHIRRVNKCFRAFATDHILRLMCKDTSLASLEDVNKCDSLANMLLTASIPNILSLLSVLPSQLPFKSSLHT